MKDLLSYHTVNNIRSTCPHSTPPAYPFTQVQFAADAPLILPLEVHQSRSKMSPLDTSETEEDAECDKTGDFLPICPRFTQYKIIDLPCLFLLTIFAPFNL